MAKIKRTVDEQIRTRLYEELKTRRGLMDDQQLVDQVLVNTTERLNEHIKAIATELSRQQAAMGHLAELREQQEDLAHHTNETTTLSVNLADVFFRSDINLLVKHLSLAEDEVIILGLTHDPQLLQRIKDLINRIDALEKGLDPKYK